MFSKKIEKAFDLMQQAIDLLKKSMNSSFLDGYIENGENIVDQFQVRVFEEVPDQQTVQQLEGIYQQLQAIELEPEEIRKLTQLVLLKGNKEEPLQANHQLTPDSIGFLFVYLLEQLTDKEKKLRILDIASGMGNLLLTVVLNLNLAKYSVQGYGVDIDDTLLSVSATNNEWTESGIQLFHQDGLQDLLIDPVDVAISDLPIGYYPNDEKAKAFVSAADSGHSYAHHLLMEQAMKFVVPDGYGLFLVSSNIFETDQSSFFKKWLQQNVYVQGIIQLPDELFRSEESRKSILIVQNRGKKSQQVEEVLLAKLSSFKDTAKLTQFFKQFEAWKSLNLK